MTLIRHGDWGPPLIYAPSSGGDHLEFERDGMLQAARPWIGAGQFQVFSIDGLGPENFWNDTIPALDRIRRYVALERYVVDEVLPYALEVTRNDNLAIVGSSYGGLVAANLLLKHADIVKLACGLGGVYGMWHRLGGYHDDDVYFHTPLEYLPRLEDETVLAAIRATRGLVMFAGEADDWLDSTRRMHELLRQKQLPHAAEYWPSPACHHEYWWSRQLRRFLERWYGPCDG